jgi:hypothetical protein
MQPQVKHMGPAPSRNPDDRAALARRLRRTAWSNYGNGPQQARRNAMNEQVSDA